MGWGMSKLVKKLHQIYGNAAQPLGFRAASAPSGKQMVLIACLQEGEGGRMAEAAKAEVDAILIHSRGPEEEQALKQVTAAIEDIPWGVWLDVMSEGCLEQLRKAGADFIIFEAATAPAALVQDKDTGKVLKVDLPEDEGLIGTINQLAIEAVLVNVKEGGEVLTISDLMHCQWLADVVDKPLLVATQRELTDKEIECLWEVGVRGLVVEVKEKQLGKSLTRLSQAIKALPAKPRRHGEEMAVLPRLGYGPDETEET